MSNVKLYQGDCLEILPTLAAGSVDAVITDPPYGMNYKHGASYSAEKRVTTRHVGTRIVGDDKPFDPSPFLGYRSVALFGANHFASKLPDSRGWMVWNKRSGMKPMDFSDCELIWTNKGGHIKQFEYMWSGVCRAGESGDVSLHPTQKPIELMKWIILQLTHEGDTILDPFMGSGTTGVACVQTGRNFIGIEIDPTYYAIAEKRIAHAQLQIRMEI
jgi:site-specific DNA-methyltransferase (adenine-specific)/modification methylase